MRIFHKERSWTLSFERPSNLRRVAVVGNRMTAIGKKKAKWKSGPRGLSESNGMSDNTIKSTGPKIQHTKMYGRGYSKRGQARADGRAMMQKGRGQQ